MLTNFCASELDTPLTVQTVTYCSGFGIRCKEPMMMRTVQMKCAHNFSEILQHLTILRVETTALGQLARWQQQPEAVSNDGSRCTWFGQLSVSFNISTDLWWSLCQHMCIVIILIKARSYRCRAAVFSLFFNGLTPAHKQASVYN